MEVRSLIQTEYVKEGQGRGQDLQEEEGDLHQEDPPRVDLEHEAMLESQFLDYRRIFIGMHSKITLGLLEKSALLIYSMIHTQENHRGLSSLHIGTICSMQSEKWMEPSWMGRRSTLKGRSEGGQSHHNGEEEVEVEAKAQMIHQEESDKEAVEVLEEIANLQREIVGVQGEVHQRNQAQKEIEKEVQWEKEVPWKIEAQREIEREVQYEKEVQLEIEEEGVEVLQMDPVHEGALRNNTTNLLFSVLI